MKEHDWKPWRFVPTPQGLWKDPQMHRQFFDWAFVYLSLSSLDDWYFVPFANIAKIGGESLIREQYNGSYMKAIVTVYKGEI